MKKSTLYLLILFLSGCTTFDKTNILPGQRVQGLGFSFEVPTANSWFAVVYGTSHRIKLGQLNFDDRYSILATLNKGPYSGMYNSASTHLRAYQRHLRRERIPAGFSMLERNETLAPDYGDLCIGYYSKGEDFQGRYHMGPAKVETYGLICPHEHLNNVLLRLELSRRSEPEAEDIELRWQAERLFQSLRFQQ